MKPQDILFIIILILLLWKRDPKLFTVAGLVCLIIAIPLFQFWVFFTAEHLVWYASGFFLFAIGSQLLKK
jgi:hypothetical protein